MDTLRTHVRCPICGKHTFKMEKDMEICPVCGWTNGAVQSRDYKSANPDTCATDMYRERYISSPAEAEE